MTAFTRAVKTMPVKPVALLVAILALGCTPPGKAPSTTMDAAPSPTDKVDTAHYVGRVRSDLEWHTFDADYSTLVFGTGDTLRMRASGLRLLTKLTSPLGKPWFIFSGTGRDDHDDARSLYVVNPGDSLSHGVQHAWHMPGRLTDGSSNGMYYEASVFAGEVLPDTVGVIWYDRSLMPDGQWRSNTTLLQLDLPKPDTLVLFGQGRKSVTIDLAVKGKCQMMAPIDQKTAPRDHRPES